MPGRLVDRIFEKRLVQAHLITFFGTAGVGVSAVGFKLMTSQLRQRRSILPLLQSLGTTLLFLHRRDNFATALSHCRARASGVYHSDRTGRRSEARSVIIELAAFRKQLANCKSKKATILAMHSRYGGRLLAYEDMASDWPAFIESIGSALGILQLRVPKALDKVDDEVANVRVENEAELRRVFAANPER